jgi:hypothetical protein
MPLARIGVAVTLEACSNSTISLGPVVGCKLLLLTPFSSQGEGPGVRYPLLPVAGCLLLLVTPLSSQGEGPEVR